MTDRRTGLASEREAFDDEARARHHADLLARTIDICLSSSDFYRANLRGAGIDGAQGVTLRQVPVTTKPEAREAMAGLGTFPLHEAKRIFMSPGPHFYASQRRADPPAERGKTPLAFALHAMGFRENDIVLNTFSYHLSPGGFGFDDQLIAAGCAVVPAGPQNTELQAEILANLPVTGYVGTPTFLKLLCDKADELGSRDRWSLAVAFVTAEKLPASLRAELEARTGATVRQIYGSADGLLPAYECWANAGMHLHPDQILEVLDPQTREPVPLGEPGEVVVTLPNLNRPLLRFATGDLVSLRDDECPCGRTGPRIDSFVGRVDEATKIRGMFVYPEQIASLLARRGIHHWHAVVDKAADGTDDLLVIVDGDPSGLDEALRDAIRVRARVEAGAVPDGAKRLDDRRRYD